MPREFPEDDQPTHNSRRGQSVEQNDDTRDIVIESSETGVTRRIKLDLEVDATAKDIGPNPYNKWIHMAKAFDAWRPFPRLFIGIYIYILYRSIEWYILLVDPTMEQSGFISVIIGAGAAWFGLYVGSGRSNR
jgi:hypothetical protein